MVIKDRAKRFIFFNRKGGVGKTSLLYNLAYILGEKGLKIHLTDMDPQGDLTHYFGEDEDELEYTVFNCLQSAFKAQPPEDIKRWRQLAEIKKGNLTLLPSNYMMDEANWVFNSSMNREYLLDTVLNTIDPDEYDYIFIDCPPSLNIEAVNAICATDSIFIPIHNFFSVKGLGRLLSFIERTKVKNNYGVEIEGIVMTMFEKRTNTHNNIQEVLQTNFPNEIYKTPIRKNVKLDQSTEYQMPIVEVDPQCNGAVDYTKLAEEFLEREGVTVG